MKEARLGLSQLRLRLRDRAKQNFANLVRGGLILALVALALLAVQLERALAGGMASTTGTGLGNFLAALLVRIGPELAVVGIGVVVIDYLNERRQEELYKEQLIFQMGSTHNDVTDVAIRALKANGWLYDGSLHEADLWAANLEEARLHTANMKGVQLREANLERAYLGKANLKWANLLDANLKMADLSHANLRRANLDAANLEKADLDGAHLEGAGALAAVNLEGSFLRNARLQGTLMCGAYADGADLRGANLRLADWSFAYLRGTNLEGANLQETCLWLAELEGSNLSDANLEGADLQDANLVGAQGWTVDQLARAKTLEGATMPDGIRLRISEKEAFRSGNPDGPAFEEWAALQTGATNQSV